MIIDSTNAGNKVESSSYMQLILAMKKNFAKDNHVAELVKIREINDTMYTCSLLNQPDLLIACRALQDLTLDVDDLVLVVFTDTDFRDNLIREQNSQTPQPIEFEQFHQLINGIIIGKVI